jgi:predicted alpha/beta superfamily hydrolase
VVRAGSKESDVRRPRVSLPRTESRDFISKINNREYSVLVSLPAGYTQDATIRFPVIYLTDANWVFATTAQTHFLLSFGNMVPAALIVGIVRAGVEEDRRPGNTVGAERFLDLTPTRVAEEERSRSKEYQREVGTGGAAALSACGAGRTDSRGRTAVSNQR